ncbi:putative conserved lipoprotein LPQO [Qipengyuania citrea LAMA 915]|uniref:Putative conserved lipoprotein LPQO n=1 Tax=Qipengyuania citrea LAMA 915 TaxID=1306953 RepID=A0A0L1KAZ8_9SPHN|nr:putative conserved lipoprotein LPQO [Qipengyuania citrea LAMA 915]
MEAPGGRRGEACDDGHARADSRGRRTWRAFSRSPRCAA